MLLLICLIILPVSSFDEQTVILPPLTLRPLRLSSDVRYGHFVVPKACVFSKLSLTISFARHDVKSNISISLRPHTIPIVTSLQLSLPRGAVLFSDWYQVSIEFSEHVFRAYTSYKPRGAQLSVTSLRHNLTGSVEITFYSPIAGPWFFSVYLFESFATGSYATLFPRIVNTIVAEIQPLIVNEFRCSTDPPNCYLDSHSTERSNNSFFNSIPTTRDESFENTKFAHGDPSNVRHHSHTKDSKRYLLTPFFLMEIKPLTDRLFSLPIPIRTTGVIFKVFACRLIGTSANSSSATLLDRDVQSCPISFSAGCGALPSTYTSVVLKQDKKSDNRNPFVWNVSQGFIFRFDTLPDDENNHFVHVRNSHAYWAIRVNFSVTVEQACSLTNEPSLNNSAAEQHVYMGTKRFTRLRTELKATASLNPRVWTASLLFWVNPSWPIPVPESAQETNKSRSFDDGSILVDPMDRVHRSLEKCHIWTPPSRVSKMQAFAYHYTYQPYLGRFADGLRLYPWNSVNIPIRLEPNLDTGGSLEISLQLNAFDVTIPVNDSHTRPLPRQVVLHACFSRRILSSPYDFVNVHRCPLWLRLATSYGLAVSVAHAVSMALADVHSLEHHPRFNTSYDEQRVDRSFLYLPYPSPGNWYLGLYPECFSTIDAFCSQDPAASIDVGLVIRSTPCLNYRCRDTGEGASLPPSRVMDPKLVEPRPLDHPKVATSLKSHWHPPWWNSGFKTSNFSLLFQNDSSPDVDLHQVTVGEGYCVELLESSIYATTCHCPIGRIGLGCMRMSEEYTRAILHHTAREDAVGVLWRGYSVDALWLALSNLAFVPAIFLAVVRQLWLPAIAYTYTAVLSALYHLCDTDLSSIPMNYLVRTSSVGQSTTISLPLNFELTSSFQHTVRLVSRICPLSIDALSFCDFFGGVFSVWVTVVALLACPVQYAQLANLVFVLSLTIVLHVARHSAALFLAPSVVGVGLIFASWLYRSRCIKRLFPPIQWWILSLLPGLCCGTTGLCLFLSPYMTRYYTKLHSVWHVLMGLSLIGFLPWPERWRAALQPVIPRHVPLSCGGTRAQNSTKFDCLERNGHLPRENSFSKRRALSTFKVIGAVLSRFYSRICSKIDDWIEMRHVLNWLVTKWPKCEVLLPADYQAKKTGQLSDCLLLTTNHYDEKTLQAKHSNNAAGRIETEENTGSSINV